LPRLPTKMTLLMPREAISFSVCASIRRLLPLSSDRVTQAFLPRDYSNAVGWGVHHYPIIGTSGGHRRSSVAPQSREPNPGQHREDGNETHGTPDM